MNDPALQATAFADGGHPGGQPGMGGPPQGPPAMGGPPMPPPPAPHMGGGPPIPEPPPPGPGMGGPGPGGPAPGGAPAATDGQTLAGFIYSFQDDPNGQHWTLFEGENLVGRAETSVKCRVPIAHGTTSTRHAQIICNGGQISVMDMKSTNGTYVNGRRIDPNVPTPLNDGDKVRFGGYTVYVLPARNRS